ncbi:NAD(P)H-dependent glycerol-3-phosphate dehydrogenase [Aliiruegeria sabulilitoris]|uniref:NAD(P)H-dependent glycerol-3-phosphate dehydrogenase n=1 Tax=Aliiruegeria sabulilitoris TaxID=1510458 RepID=UPI0009E8E832|nr:NAD(P)H-dependent glycerol-3-phosphate dehydrogenase [Aliiruegeria sabulilitoris]NDR59003.1 NAD(P)-dependent glycerol-3-phosphate dehydrogenase [Pseudoruegeria sp. M32A2M]
MPEQVATNRPVNAPIAKPYASVAVIGAGAWGTALAAVARKAGREVRLWGRNSEDIATISKTGRNLRYLPGIDLPPGIAATSDMGKALDGAEAVLVVTPSVTLREICQQMAPYTAPDAPLVLCAKGIETGSGKLLSEVVGEELPGHQIGALSGPTFARETALNYPTAVTLAFPFAQAHRREPHAAPASRMALSLGSANFRPYISDDLVGVEVAGAVKNVVAIACGMMTGAGYAENTRAALITWGIDEMKALAEVLGGRRETIAGLSGIGDLTLTCSSTTSRNMSFGVQLGRGVERQNLFNGNSVVVEGEINAISVIDLADRIGLEMPVCRAVYRILHEGAGLRETFAALWSRPLTGESKVLNLALEHPASS